jgi:5'-nucleotidase
VAPATEQSASGHSLTLRRPLRIEKRGRRRWAVDGTPTDSVLLGVKQVLGDGLPDFVLSGINRGGNMGEDVTYSGTVAAAMEGALLGIPSIAFSQDMAPGGEPKWETAEAHLPAVLEKLAGASWPKGVLINVNFPDVPPDEVTGMRIVVQGRRKPGGRIVEAFDPAGRAYYWIGSSRDEVDRASETDLEAVHEKAISINPLHLDLTHLATVRSLKEQWG